VGCCPVPTQALKVEFNRIGVKTFGTAGRDIAQSPGYTDWDFSLFNNIRLGENSFSSGQNFSTS
jgi:hypothetical protein